MKQWGHEARGLGRGLGYRAALIDVGRGLGYRAALIDVGGGLEYARQGETK